MNRRAFIAGLGGAAAGPLVARGRLIIQAPDFMRTLLIALVLLGCTRSLAPAVSDEQKFVWTRVDGGPVIENSKRISEAHCEAESALAANLDQGVTLVSRTTLLDMLMQQCMRRAGYLKTVVD